MRCLAQAAVEAGLVQPPTFTVATLGRGADGRVPAGGATAARPGLGGHGGGRASAPTSPSSSPWPHGPARWTWATPTWCCSVPIRPGSTWPSWVARSRRCYAGGINVEFISVGPGPDALTLRVWERGVGETQACGTGSVAAAAAAHELGPGGTTGGRAQPGGHPAGGLRSDAVVLSGPVLPWPRWRSDGPAGPWWDRAGPVGRPGRRGGRSTHVTPTDSAFTDTLISRTVRERIVLVGVTLPHSTLAGHRGRPRRAGPAGGHGRRRRDGAGRPAPEPRPTPPPTWAGARPRSCLSVCLAVDADTVVFDDDLSPAQQRNLEKILGRTAIDRTAVILDIFAQNARTPEGRAQVELALLRYRLPRLRGRGRALQPAGRRHRHPGARRDPARGRPAASGAADDPARRPTSASSSRTRRTQRRGRARSRQRTVSLVGYTNAGKSTLLNRLCGADVLVENRLFSTLDPRTRQLDLPGGETVLLTDTVGFVRKLPHQVVEAFRSTLEVVGESDLILHVVDGSAPDFEGQVDAVRTVLAEIGADGLPELLVVNKADAVRPGAGTAPGDGERRPDEGRAARRPVDSWPPTPGR